MSATLQAPEGFKIINHALFEAWARRTVMPPSYWQHSLKQRTSKKLADIGVMKVQRITKPKSPRLSEMSEKTWKFSACNVRRVIVSGGRPYYIWCIDLPGKRNACLCDSPEEVWKEIKEVVS